MTDEEMSAIERFIEFGLIPFSRQFNNNMHVPEDMAEYMIRREAQSSQGIGASIRIFIKRIIDEREKLMRETKGLSGTHD